MKGGFFMNELIIIAIVTVAFATIYFFIFIHTDVKISSKPIVMYVNLVNSVEETERITRDIICKMIERYENVELYVFLMQILAKQSKFLKK